MNRVDWRTALGFGGFASAILFVPFALLILGASGMECPDCGIDRPMIATLLLLAAFAAMFGLIAGSAAALLKPLLDRRLHPLAAAVILAFAIAAATAPIFRSTPWLLGYAGYLTSPGPSDAAGDCDQRKLPPNVLCAH